MQKIADPELFRRNAEVWDLEVRARARIKDMARRLYILAWVIEGVAVSLGLGMALSLNLPGESTVAEFLHLAGRGAIAGPNLVGGALPVGAKRCCECGGSDVPT
jgi:hypothetical protein